MKAVRRLSKRLSVVRKDNLSNDVVSFRGVSLGVLEELAQAVQDGSAAPGVELYECVEAHDRFQLGDSVQLVDKAPQQPSSLLSLISEKQYAGRWRAPEGVVQDVLFLPSKFKRKERKEWNMHDVTVFVLMVRTQENQERFVDTVGREGRGSAFAGIFVSQSHTSRFADLVHALHRYFEDKGIAPRSRFVWLDICSANQHVLHNDKAGPDNKLHFLLESSLRRGIDRFDDRVVFFDRWDRPTPLSRAWCVWEMHIMRSKAGGTGAINIIVPPALERKLPDMMLDDVAQVRAPYASFDSRAAAAMNERDHEMIHAIFRDSAGGYVAINGAILGGVRVAALDTIRRAVQRSVQNDNLGADSPEAAALLTRLGVLLTEEQLYDAAVDALRSALSTLRSVYGPDDMRVAQVLGYLGNALADQGKPSEAFKALTCYEEELAITRKALPENHPDIATVLNNLACLLEDVERYDEALEAYLEALSIWRQQPDAESSEEEAIVLLNIGSLYFQKGQLEKASQYTSESIDLFKAIDASHERLPEVYTNLAVIFHSEGKIEAAMDQMRSAESVASDPDMQADVQLLMANMLDDDGKIDDALTLYKAAYATLVEHYGARHTRCADVLNFMGALCQTKGKFADALSHFENALSIRMELLGEKHPETAQTLFNMAQSLESQGHIDQALERSKDALDAFRSAYGSDHPDTKDAKRQYDRLERIARELGHRPSAPQLGSMAGRRRPRPPAGARRSRRELLAVNT
ncbi:Kinesin light chain 3 [Hondaea fermentalgiana]|uniref:Kinesin light chain 3 n=1 Tax=Hondaea fermentalgiana TaxID=2315210 RepID=A0A2R5GBU7_9STRA|nr:Kinesin light chain 3 [Hondaea fermentalgiana]|eukprot:GBG28460.1 Kinesin light chain 3 [Hondaea fermentalgiana]